MSSQVSSQPSLSHKFGLSLKSFDSHCARHELCSLSRNSINDNDDVSFYSEFDFSMRLLLDTICNLREPFEELLGTVSAMPYFPKTKQECLLTNSWNFRSILLLGFLSNFAKRWFHFKITLFFQSLPVSKI